MALETIRKIVKRRDGCTDSDVDQLFKEALILLDDGEDLEEVIQEVFGLEPDYLFDDEFLVLLRS